MSAAVGWDWSMAADREWAPARPIGRMAPGDRFLGPGQTPRSWTGSGAAFEVDSRRL